MRPATFATGVYFYLLTLFTLYVLHWSVMNQIDRVCGS